MKGDGTVLNFVQIISECFNESLALREMIAQKFGETENEITAIRAEQGENFQLFTNACSRHLNDSKTKSETDLAK